jgi:uncharacterized protein (TIGR02996 family)
MSLEEAFLREIVEKPADDVSRLVYADWLDEHGQPERADFIRLQCRLASLPEGDPHREELARQGQKLLDAHQDAWLAALPEWARRGTPAGSAPVFRRGFVAEVEVSALDLAGGAEQLWRAAPVEAVTIHHPGPESVRALMRVPQLSRLRALTLDLSGEGVGDGAARALADAPHLGGLTSLAVYADDLGDTGVAALAESPRLGGLAELTLDSYPFGDAALQALAASGHLAGLTRLTLRAEGYGDAGARALAASPFLRRLRVLGLNGRYGGGPLGDAGVEALAASPNLDNVTDLALAEHGIGDRGASALAESSRLAGLRRLDLALNQIGDAGVAALAASVHLANLSRLDLWGNVRIGDAGARALAASLYLANLRRLTLSVGGLLINHQVGPAGRQLLVERFGDRVRV